MSATLYRTPGFVLRKIDFGEADRFYEIFTKEFGKIELLAKGVRKISSKLKSCLEPFGLIELEFIQGRRYRTLTDVWQKRPFSSLRDELGRMQLAFAINVLPAKLLKGEEKDEAVWQLLEETFKRLDSPSFAKGPKADTYHLIYYYFFWHFVSLLGYAPELQKCGRCLREITPSKLFFMASEGGVLCSSCKRRGEAEEGLSLNTLKLLRLILRKDWLLLRRVKVSPQDLEELAAVSGNYLTFVEENL